MCLPVLASSANATLLDNATELHALFEAAFDAIVITDDDGRLMDANPAALELFARPRGEILSRRLGDFVDAGSDFAADWGEFLRAGWAHMELLIVRPGGEMRTAECSSRASFVPGRHFSFLRDVTERRRLEEQVRHAQKMEAIGRLVGGIAHDFNNLLAAVLIYAGLLGGELADDPRLRRYVEEIRGAGERGSALVAQLLALGRKEALEPRVLSLGEAVEGMRDLLQLSLGEEIELRIERLAAPDTVRVDPTQLHQVVLNLALNARDAMPGGGRLVIECRAREVASGDVDAPAGRYIVLQMRDTGCGMKPEVRAQIFEPFFTTKPRGKGTGLGLSMVYGIVRQRGGAVQVESAPGAGTTVSVFLPAVNEEEEGGWKVVNQGFPATLEEQGRNATAAPCKAIAFRR